MNRKKELQSEDEFAFLWKWIEQGATQEVSDSFNTESHWWDEIEDGECAICGGQTYNDVCMVCYFNDQTERNNDA